MAPKLQLALLALFAFAAVASADELLGGRRFTKEEVLTEAGAIWNDKEGRFAWWNETVEDPMAAEHEERRSVLGLGDSSPVTVTFYDSPGMYCTDGENRLLGCSGCEWTEELSLDHYGRDWK
jgi:hypothetical protein